MLRFFIPIAILGGVTTLVACSGRDPVADNAVNGAEAPAEVDVLPPDESMATPTNELENGDDEDVNVGDASSTASTIPAAFQGRWGLTPADCVESRSDTKGLLVVAADRLQFYEARAKPAGELRLTPKSVSGSFDFTGEGQNWKKHQVLELQDHKLVRTESDPMASYTYARCTS
jgi:hypothetical protein